ncbi:unnamed protein product [Echinostoma caproni]|uniref:Uncharacterized protein n=1 Tax=Echinostoma caproni TaxID=27848 RepID=A0A3P8KVS5_9TREM|nr:unnamed protein product [Echinostoma caproni]
MAIGFIVADLMFNSISNMKKRRYIVIGDLGCSGKLDQKFIRNRVPSQHVVSETDPMTFVTCLTIALFSGRAFQQGTSTV